MTTSDEIDAKWAPLIVKLNQMRQIRDNIPMSLLTLVPYPLRAIMDEVFAFVEERERERGIELERRKLAGEK